jgi:pectin methylesterase-like acyl-CoA thioesterase
MRILLVAAFAVLLNGAAQAQTENVPRYGEEDKTKSRSQVEADKAAERAYQHSLTSIPDKGSTDPWGAVRNDTPRASSAKTKTKTGSTGAKSGNPN